ncbi:MAG: NAD(P)H-dependent glycerol-3-phosphate dehydrogenase [Candidatus Rokuibacteriota bacterium]
MRVAVLGAGSWGTALAVHLGRQGLAVRLWARDPSIAAAITGRRHNPFYLEDVALPAPVAATADQDEAVGDAEVVLLAVPSEFVAGTLKSVPALREGAAVVSATKGFDPERHLRISELIAERFPTASVAVLSGPTFAREVARAQPTAAVLASADEGLATRLRDAWGTREFRLYTNRDVAGVEIGGAMKNVIALATGLADGLGLGENARAALVTRGLTEVMRLGAALGAVPTTLTGLSGLGDLVLTCTGSLSRNRALGIAIARGRPLVEAQGATRMVAEGVPTVRTALVLARRAGVSVPISEAVGSVLFAGWSPSEALAALLGRAATREDPPSRGQNA